MDSAAGLINERTVGVIGVHLYGRPFSIAAARDLCAKKGLWLIEDAAQAHGAEWGGKRVGNFGALATWSFYPAKNLGCFGDGGAVTGCDAALLDRVRMLANHGRIEHYRHAEPGMNSRLDGLQAAVLSCRLQQLDEGNRRRLEIANRYREELSEVGDLRFLVDQPATRCVYHQMTVLTEQRDALRDHLAEDEIGTAVHRQPAFEKVARQNRLEIAEAAGGQVLCLPMFPELSDGEVDRVCRRIRQFF